jgi:predicted permease
LPTLPRLNELTLDLRTVVFAAASLAIAGAVCGVVPALTATTRRVSGTLASGGRGATAGSHRLQQALVTGQVALSLLLVGSATLLARSYATLQSAPGGFSADHTLTFHMAASWDEDRDRLGELQQHFVDALATIPGVQAAGLTNFLPMSAATLRYQVTVAGLAGTDAGGAMTTGARTVTSGYLQALRVPLVAGSWCPAFVHDFKQPQLALVNRQFVSRFANGANLIGRDLRFSQSPQIPQTIIGVVGDVAEDGPGVAPVPYLYSCALAGGWPDANYVVRTSGDPEATTATIRGLVRQLDPSRAMFGAAPLDRVIDGAMDEPRTQMGLVGVLAAAAMLLAAIGLYGLFTLIVAESRREIGVRLALGAAPASVARLVLARAGRLVAVGLAIGAVLSAAASRSLHALLYGARSLDETSLLLAAIVLAAVSAAAIVVPAVRASRVDATEALRDTGA